MLHYEISGNADKTLVLLHGLMENSHIWDGMQSRLEKDFRLVKIDLPGHGKSELTGEISTVEMMATKVKQVTDELNLTDFYLLGHSMGGYTALAFAEKWPEVLAGFSLFFSTYLPDSEEKKETRRKSFRIIEQEYERYVAAGVPMNFHPHEAEEMEGVVEIAKEMALQTNNLGALAAVKGIMERPDRQSVLQEFQGKILVMLGRHDSAIDSLATLKGLPDKANIKAYLLDCAHNGHWERPEICAEIICRELK
ncbi:alpha/beta hydrolase [Cruoricaptor ignavus]|uniref:Alpha/beta hydrolase n=1 Tax=Cruoricaptor ignavus TaxID=1118202 RepID=A0A7M1T0Z0_9FLAO|nr:alpha/beta hydrolase [Cruoricaptor ignavus]QOR73498.1 alpha/beta hydrolase [Cruoricaptor ignavus]